MSSEPYWVRGAVFGVLFVLLVFFLKVICPIRTGCFADPFLVILFSPLLLVKAISLDLGIFEPFFIVFFWALVASILAGLYGKIAQGPTNTEIVEN